MRRLMLLLVWFIFAVTAVHSFPQSKTPKDSPLLVKSASPSRNSYSCYFDWDCRGGYCCSTIIPGCIGYCIPCAAAQARSFDQPASPKCVEDYDCLGGFCCSALQPGLEGDCVPCGGGKDLDFVKELKEEEKQPNEDKEDQSPKCQYDADCPGGYCCYQEIPGLDGQCVVCGKEPASKEYCKYDTDCPEGFCCDLYYPYFGECKPCEGEKKEDLDRMPTVEVDKAEKKVQSTSPRCQYDSVCPGGYCCYQEIPGLDGECLVCGKVQVDAKGRSSGCYSHIDCPGVDCCWQDQYGEPGICVDCCI